MAQRQPKKDSADNQPGHKLPAAMFNERTAMRQNGNPYLLKKFTPFTPFYYLFNILAATKSDMMDGNHMDCIVRRQYVLEKTGQDFFHILVY
jgi:hypothetical protein